MALAEMGLWPHLQRRAYFRPASVATYIHRWASGGPPVYIGRLTKVGVLPPACVKDLQRWAKMLGPAG